MSPIGSRLFSFVFACVLWSCAGTDFVRPDPASLKNGETTYVQATQRFGKPFREGTVTKNDQTIKVLSYAYASAGGTPLHQGAVAGRALSLYFYNDVLVGHEFISTWLEDNTDFDESKVGQIAKGQTTRADLTQLLGRPSGYLIYPMIKSRTGEAAVYVYSETMFSRKNYRKTLVVSFDQGGIVSDVDFNSSSSH